LPITTGHPHEQPNATVVSWRTANTWTQRYRAEGETGMHDRSSRPHRQPNRNPQPVVRKILHLRSKRRLGPVPIADQLGLAASTVHAVLKREHANRLSHLDRATSEPIHRYEHDHPGDLLHVDVKKLGNVPDGGGWRYLGRQAGDRNRQATTRRRGDYEPAVWFATRGVTVRRVLSDNGSACKSRLWTSTCAELGITVKKTRPYRPQTSGKIKRFHRTLAAHHAQRRLQDTALPARPGTRRAARAPWFAVLDAGVCQCRAMETEASAEAPLPHSLLNAASTIAVTREAAAQETVPGLIAALVAGVLVAPSE
jgi:transposase InsO family protein